MCNNITWDLDGLLTLEDLGKLEDSEFILKDKEGYYLSFSAILSCQYYFNFLNVYKRTTQYTCNALLGVYNHEFTTNENIYNHTGIYYVKLDEKIEKVVLYANTDILSYMFVKLNEYIFKEPFLNIVITGIGKRSYDEDEREILNNFLNLKDINIFYENISKDEVLQFIDKKNVDGNKLYTIYSTLNNKNVFCEGISKEEILSHFGL